MDYQKIYKVITFAYACEPHLGSEPEVGWQWVSQIARQNYNIWCITRESNRAAIEKEMSHHAMENLHFIYFDYPAWLRFWKKGRQGIHIYYVLWQIGAYFKVKKLHKKINFDIAHHITFVNSWLPGFIAWLNIPFIWGPIGSNQVPFSIPLLMEFGVRGAVNEILRRIIYKASAFNPLMEHTIAHAKKIITINNKILENKKNVYADKIIVKPAIAIHDSIFNTLCKDALRKEPVVLFGGHALYLKGVTLAVKAFINFAKTNDRAKLIIAGSGTELNRVKKIIDKSGINGRVMFAGDLPRNIYLGYLSTCDVFLYPSFEGGGLVVLEAMALGKPVVCLDWGGPGEFITEECGIKVKVGHPEQMIHNLSSAIDLLANNDHLRNSMGVVGRKRVKEHYNWESVGKLIDDLYRESLL